MSRGRYVSQSRACSVDSQCWPGRCIAAFLSAYGSNERIRFTASLLKSCSRSRERNNVTLSRYRSEEPNDKWYRKFRPFMPGGKLEEIAPSILRSEFGRGSYFCSSRATTYLS